MQDFSEKNIVYAHISNIFGGKGLLFAQRCERKFEGRSVLPMKRKEWPPPRMAYFREGRNYYKFFSAKKQNTPEKTCFV